MSDEKFGLKRIKLPIESTENDVFTAGMIRDFSKWVLDLMRNIIIVGVVQYMAAKTESAWVEAASLASYGALTFYCGSYLFAWMPRTDMGESKVVRWTVFIGLTLVFIGLLAVLNIVLYRVVGEIANAQTR
jgi:hypothetical protein